MNEGCASLKQALFAPLLMKDERCRGQGDIGEEWGWENNKEAEPGVAGQKAGFPRPETATSLLVTAWGGHTWVVNPVWGSGKNHPVLTTSSSATG